MWLNTKNRFGRVSIILHWAIGLLFLAQIPLGYAMETTDGAPNLQEMLFSLHKATGMAVLILASVRLVWAAANATPRFVPGLSQVEIQAAKTVKIILFLVSGLVPLLGWSLTAGHASISIYGLFSLPSMPVTVSRSAHRLLAEWHIYLAYGAGIVALLHTAAALQHHYLRRDETLLRMLGRGRGRPGSERR